MKHYFLGLAANYSTAECWRHVLGLGLGDRRRQLREFLAEKYDGRAILTKNGRSGLALALIEYLEPGEGVLVNGFTCYAVYEAIEAAGLVPVWVDINRGDLNFDVRTLEKALRRGQKCAKGVRGMIVQNTLGNPVEMREIEKFAKQHDLVIIEDLAHCVGVCYPDGREVGTVGVAAVLSFGKDKRIDATSGGAVVMRAPGRAERSKIEAAKINVAQKNAQKTRNEARSELRRTGVAGHGKTEAERSRTGVVQPTKRAPLLDRVRVRFYPFFGVVARGLTYLHLSTPWMWLLLKLHLVEKSADNQLDLEQQITKLEAKCALRQLKALEEEINGGEQVAKQGKNGGPEAREAKHGGIGPLRRFYLVRDRGELLGKLKKRGYYFGGFWYERPVSPERYYKRVEFPEAECPVATEVAQQIVNVPEYYSEAELAPAMELIREYEVAESAETAKNRTKSAKNRPILRKNRGSEETEPEESKLALAEEQL